MRTNRRQFPAEDDLPRDMGKLAELIREAQDARLSFRYVNVLRHRLMDAVMDEINEGRL